MDELKITQLSDEEVIDLNEIIMKHYDPEKKPYIRIIANQVYIVSEDYTINFTSRFIEVFRQVKGLDIVPNQIVESLRQVVILMMTSPEWASSFSPTKHLPVIDEPLSDMDEEQVIRERKAKQIKDKKVKERREEIRKKMGKKPKSLV